jgi:hypothetical protein
MLGRAVAGLGGEVRTTARVMSGVVFVVALAVSIATDAVPSSAVMVASLVAAATLGTAETVAFASAGAVATVLVATMAHDTRGSDLATAIGFAVAVGAIAVAVAASTSRRRAHDAVAHGEPEAARITSALMHARTVEDVATIAVERAAVFGASVARLAVRGERDTFTYIADTLPEPVHHEHPVFSLHGEDAAALAIQARRPAYWPKFDAFRRKHPRSGAVLEVGDPQSVAIMPLIGERSSLGVWVLGFAEPCAFDAEERARLEQATTEVTVALERSVLF